MGKVSLDDIKNLGFTPEQFSLTAATFDAWLQGVIDEQAMLLEVRVGATAYASAVTATAAYVKRAEKCLVAAELFQRRIVSIAGNAVPNGQEPETTALDKQKRAMLAEAQGLIDRLAASAVSDASDFACGAVITSHFEDDNA
ncbi:MAG: hypothetical protein OEV73_00125 [Desulfobulbaceae bacterium]|nr:hypothetical protein [Desulfobulbaceae bacterium]